MNKNEINALISLLEDPDHDIYFQVRNKLVQLGVEIIPDLENAWEMNFDSLVQSRAERIIHEIQFNFTQVELKKLDLQSQKRTYSKPGFFFLVFNILI